MPEWEHKERIWWGLYQYSPLESRDFQKFAAKEAMELSTWLDWQCKGGWEVFEIKRDFETNNTLCLFRKLVD